MNKVAGGGLLAAGALAAGVAFGYSRLTTAGAPDVPVKAVPKLAISRPTPTPAAVPAPPVAAKEPVVAGSDLAKTFLTADDLPGMSKNVEYVQPGNFEDDKARDLDFDRLGGQGSGLREWKAVNRGDVVSHVIDIRYVFPSAAAARDYLRAQGGNMTDGHAPVAEAPAFGDESKSYGTYDRVAASLLGKPLCHHVVLFRQNNVVVKLYACVEEPTQRVTPLSTAPLVQKVVDHIREQSH